MLSEFSTRLPFIIVILVLISRGSVYFFGFFAVILLSVTLPKEEFGRFSLIQSSSELAIILCSAGSALLYTRIGIKRGARAAYLSIIKTVAIAWPLGALVLFAILGRSVSLQEYLLVFFAVTIQAINLLLMSALRGEGSSLLINYEAAIRGAITSIILLLFVFYSKPSTVAIVLAIALVGNSVVFLMAWYSCHFKSKNYDRKISSKLLISLKYFGYSIIQFFLRKSDIIFVSYFFGFSYAADYKIAFLFSESILQFTQAYINTKISFVADSKSGIFLKAKIFRKAFFLSFLCLIGALSIHVIYAFYSKTPFVNATLIVLLVYFTFRACISFNENLLSIKLPGKELASRAVIELLVRAMIVFIVCVVFGFNYVYIFIPIAIFEFYFYHYSVRHRYAIGEIAKAGIGRCF